MIISFFEEFIGEKSFDKLKFIKKGSRLFIAAKSVDEFLLWKKKLSKKGFKDLVYWPILSKKEGYWISPFSSRKALKRIFSELEGEKIKVMIDAELPTRQNMWLYLSECLLFFSNRKLIREFVSKRENVYVAEYFPESLFMEKVLSFLGLHFDCREYGCRIIKMMYSSLHGFSDDFMKSELKRGVAEFDRNFLVGLGTIALGINGDEKVLCVSGLKRDLNIAHKAGVNEVVLFRLGGMNKRYGEFLRKF